MRKNNFIKRRRFVFIRRFLIGIFLVGLVLFQPKDKFYHFLIQDVFFKQTPIVSKEGVSHQNPSNVGDLSNQDLVSRLLVLSNQDGRIHTILEHMDDYPEELLDMLSRNLEMLDFVLEFPEKKGQIFENTIGNVKKGTFPLLLQWDSRWGYASYGENYLAISGCAPTALAMVVAGLTGKNSITPYTISQFALENGYYIDGVGTSWDLMTEGSKHFGIMGKEITLSKQSIYSSLEQGHPIICSMRPGDFTTQGHFIVLVGIWEDKIMVNDPNSKKRSAQLWEYETLEYQIKNLWSFQRK